MWIAERLQKELESDHATILNWLNRRYESIFKAKDKFDEGPILILHLIPSHSDISLNPEQIADKQNLLTPIENATSFSGRINFYGYETRKVFEDTGKTAGYVQVFREGPLESVRVIQATAQNTAILGDLLDNELIHAVWTYSAALHDLKISLPVKLFVRLSGIVDHALVTQAYYSRNYGHVRSLRFESNDIGLPAVDISDWKSVSSLAKTASTLKSSLDMIWNSSGIKRSPSFLADGQWIHATERNTRKDRDIAMRKPVKLRQSFYANDEFGNEHLIHVYVEVLDVGTLDDPSATVEGLKSLRTSTGFHVNLLSKGNYKIVESGQLLHSDDPEAP
jgi:hypothetical protein